MAHEQVTFSLPAEHPAGGERGGDFNGWEPGQHVPPGLADSVTWAAEAWGWATTLPSSAMSLTGWIVGIACIVRRMAGLRRPLVPCFFAASLRCQARSIAGVTGEHLGPAPA